MTPSSMLLAIRRLSLSNAVFTAVTRGMSIVDRRSSPMCGSKWLLSRHDTSRVVLVRHSSMLSSSQLDAYARNVGSLSSSADGRSGGVHVAAWTAVRCSSSSTCARAGVQPSRSVPKRTRWRQPSTVMRSQNVRSPSLRSTISTLPRAGRGTLSSCLPSACAPRAVRERLLGGRVCKTARNGPSVAGGVGHRRRDGVVRCEDAARHALRREAPLTASRQSEAAQAAGVAVHPVAAAPEDPGDLGGFIERRAVQPTQASLSRTREGACRAS